MAARRRSSDGTSEPCQSVSQRNVDCSPLSITHHPLDCDTALLYSPFHPARRGRLRRRSKGGADAAPARCLASIVREARVTVRSNYVGLPSMAGRGAAKGGESRPGAIERKRPMGDIARSVPGSTVPRPKIAARGAPRGERRAAGSRTPACQARPMQESLLRRQADCGGIYQAAPFGAPPPRIEGQNESTTLRVPRAGTMARERKSGCLKIASANLAAAGNHRGCPAEGGAVGSLADLGLKPQLLLPLPERAQPQRIEPDEAFGVALTPQLRAEEMFGL
jgi:hypothetical protein